MSIPDEEQFEAYLKHFKPLAPDPLPARNHRAVWRLWVVGVATAAAIIILGMVGLRIHRSHIAKNLGNPISAEVHVPVQPLTIKTANGLLRTHRSYKAALDAIAFSGQKSRIPDDKRSAVQVLSKERVKL